MTVWASVAFAAYSIFSAETANTFSLLFPENNSSNRLICFPNLIAQETKGYIYNV